jgi:hypothetical protein
MQKQIRKSVLGENISSGHDFDLFPVDPFVVHTPPVGQSFDAVTKQKRQNFDQMVKSAQSLDNFSKSLVEKAAFLSFQCHFNHFRGGKERPHYSIHLLEVAKRVDRNFDSFSSRFEQQFDKTESPLMPKSIVISIALLHDAIEDFHENFRGTAIEIREQQAQAISENHIRNQLGVLIGFSAGNQIVDLIKILSIYNENEFPTTEYLENIKTNIYTYMVKLADVDHNLSTFASYSPVYPALIIPAQYGNFSIGTVYENSFVEQLLINISAFDPNELVPWRPGTRTKTVEYLLSQIEKYEGRISIERIPNYYAKLFSDISEGNHDIFLGKMKIKQTHIVAQIGSILSVIERYYHSSKTNII